LNAAAAGELGLEPVRIVQLDQTSPVFMLLIHRLLFASLTNK
jgi:hypothetical protein